MTEANFERSLRAFQQRKPFKPSSSNWQAVRRSSSTIRKSGRRIYVARQYDGHARERRRSLVRIQSPRHCKFKGSVLTVNEAQKSSEEPRHDRFSDLIDRLAHCDRREGPEFGKLVHDLHELAEAGHVEAAQELADILALPGPYYDPESAYKWYYIALSQRGYTVQFEDHNRTPPNYCGPAGDFRNESVVSGLVDTPGFDKIRSLDAEAARWLAERNLTHG